MPYQLVEVRGVGKDEEVRVLKESADWEEVEAERNVLQERATRDGNLLSELRYAVRIPKPRAG